MERSATQVANNFIREISLGLVSVRMSPIAFHLDYFLYPPVIALCIYLNHGGLGLIATALLFVSGLLAWTLAEYLLHRFVLHGRSVFAKYHQAHHDDPGAMIAAPPLLSLSLFLMLALLPAILIIGLRPALPLFAGFLSGYLAFGAIHQLVHHSQSHHALIRHFKKFHARHHHGSNSHNFGVLTGFWDRIFGTYEMPNRNRSKDLRPVR